MRSKTLAMAGLLVVAASLPLALADETRSPEEAEAAAVKPDAHAAFEKLNTLVGVWEAVIDDEGTICRLTYSRLAGGSVLMETCEFVGNPESTMVTLFHMDGDDLVLKHYCAARNQPEMKATKWADDLSTIEFTFTGGTNLPDENAGHMHNAKYRFIDADHFSDRWSWFESGQETWMHEFTYERKKPEN